MPRDDNDRMDDRLKESNQRRGSAPNADIGNGARSDRRLDGCVSSNGLKEPDECGWTPTDADRDDLNGADMPSHHHHRMEDRTNEPSQERRASPNPNIGHQWRAHRRPPCWMALDNGEDDPRALPDTEQLWRPHLEQNNGPSDRWVDGTMSPNRLDDANQCRRATTDANV